MSRPRFLADNDLNDAIAVGVLRREPAAEFARLRDLGLARRSDPEVLDFAARENWIVVSHDVNTMRAAGSTRLTAGLPMNGLLLAHQRTPISAIIEPGAFLRTVLDLYGDHWQQPLDVLLAKHGHRHSHQQFRNWKNGERRVPEYIQKILMDDRKARKAIG